MFLTGDGPTAGPFPNVNSLLYLCSINELLSFGTSQYTSLYVSHGQTGGHTSAYIEKLNTCRYQG